MHNAYYQKHSHSRLALVMGTLMPPSCVHCGLESAIYPGWVLCDTCSQQLSKLPENALCPFCGIPLLGSNNECLDCRTNMPEFDSLRSLWWYDGPARSLLHAAKFDGHNAALLFLAQGWKKWAQFMLAKIQIDTPNTVLCSVPAHPKSRFLRGYDLVQRSVLLSGLGPAIQALDRRPGGKSQKTLSRADRQQNLARQISIKPRAANIIADKTVILCDDIVTTGASLSACSRELKKHGATRVICLTLFRD